MFMNKKAVSPIIAAVLLVVITIAIGATTMAFIRSLSDQNLASAQEKSEKISCGTDVAFEVVAINNAYKICNGTTAGVDWVAATLKNKGSKDIKSFRLVALGTDNVEIGTNSTSIAKDSYGKVNITFNSSNSGAVSEFVIEPVIQAAPGSDIICSDSEVTWKTENMGTC